MKRACIVLCFLSVGFFLFNARAQAQDLKNKLLKDERSRQSHEFPEIKEPFYFDFGFWHKFGYYHYEDLGGGSTNEHARDLRLHRLYAWTEVVLDRTHRFYARIATLSFDYSKGDGGIWDHKIYKPRLDMGFYEYRTEAVKGSQSTIKQYSLRFGRQLLKVGSGFTYRRIHDGIRAGASTRMLDAEAFFAQSIPSEDNIDQSKPGNNRQRRNFYGAQVSLRKWQNHTPFVYVLLQRDRQGEKIKNIDQNFIFHSNYIGIGSKGSLCRKVNYRAEYVIMGGKRHADSIIFPFPLGKTRIEAYAFDSKIEYIPGGVFKTVLSLQYMFGSGDSDRLQPTDTYLGNEPFTSDATFVAFGHVETGYALYPMVSNLHVFRLSGSFMPLRNSSLFSKLRVGTAFITFQKHKRGGGISTRKSQTYDNKNVGWEVDFFAQWEVFSDLHVTVKWGHFDPGNAFSSDSGMRRNLDYYFLGVIYSF
jgi:hypothetical protein